MNFKFHKSYRGFYLLNGEKFHRPFKRLDEEQTAKNISIVFNKEEILTIADKDVVFQEKKEQTKKKETKKKDIKKIVNLNNFKQLELSYGIPSLVIENLEQTLLTSTKGNLVAVLNIIKNIMDVDGLFSTKVKKIFYYNEEELFDTLKRYNLVGVASENLLEEIVNSYPKQYVSRLPLDYKENEMIFVFYFIILIELLSIVK